MATTVSVRLQAIAGVKCKSRVLVSKALARLSDANISGFHSYPIAKLWSNFYFLMSLNWFPKVSD